MITDHFGAKTLAIMEHALDEACKLMPAGGERHDDRRYIADRILECAERGDTSLHALSEAGRGAAGELCASSPPGKREAR
jgi:hypothetical protein